MVTFEKSFSREGSLLYCFTWQQSNQRQQAAWLGFNVRHLLFVRNSGDPKVGVWYDPEELDSIYAVIGQKTQRDPGFLPRVVEAFRRHAEVLFPYARGTLDFHSLADVETYYSHWLEWWMPMAILFVLPNVDSAPQSARDEALRIRAETEWFDGDPPLMAFLAKKLPADREIVPVMTLHDVRGAWDESLSVSQRQVLATRARRGYALLDGDLLPREDLDRALLERELRLSQTVVDPAATEFRGVAASPGSGRGRVRVIYGSGDLRAFQEGEVLVTTMTHPEYLPVMQTCSAIVTDEGGITSHAAIVSRELKKPCVIGTKIATKVLCNGDLVEVDAERGVVRILKRAG